MKSIILSFIILSTIAVSNVKAFDCSVVVVQGGKQGLLDYLATVSFTVPKALDGDWTMELKTDVPFTFLGGWGVWIKSEPDSGTASFRSRLENYTLAEGDQVSFRFRISWFTGEERPAVTSLTWEGVQLCKESVADAGKTITALRIRRTLFEGSNGGPSRRVNYRKRYFVNV